MEDRITCISIDLSSIDINSYDETIRVRRGNGLGTVYAYRAGWSSIYIEEFTRATGFGPFSIDIDDPEVAAQMKSCGLVFI
jgi:hypothetical protein